MLYCIFFFKFQDYLLLICFLYLGYMYIIYIYYRDCSCINQIGLIFKFQFKKVDYYNFMYFIILVRFLVQKMLELNKFKKFF